jgi:DedD protein
METRMKERLVGAIALVVIVVIVVPELLTGERTAPPKPAAAAPGSARTVTIDLTSKERGAIARPPGASAAPGAVPYVAPSATPSAPLPLEAGPEREPSPAPAAAAAAPAAPPADPPAAPRTTSPAAPAPHPGESWIVQLGSFQSRDNAEHLAAALRAKGYSAFVSEFRGSGRVLYRVRVGPEQDRARADAIAARLTREGHRGSVTPEP